MGEPGTRPPRAPRGRWGKGTVFTVATTVVALVISLIALFFQLRDRGSFEVVAFSTDGAALVPGTVLTPGEEEAAVPGTTETEATVVTATLKNNTNDLMVFDTVEVETLEFVPVTDCVTGVGGSVTVTGTYEVNVPPEGEVSTHGIAYALEPRKAEAVEFTLGSERLKEGVVVVGITLVESGGERADLGEAAVLLVPGLAELYPRPLEQLPIGKMPSASCVRDTLDDLLEVSEEYDNISAGVTSLIDGLTETSAELPG